jgi:hypothetical protein
MIKNIHLNGYFLQHKVVELISCAENSEENKALESYESKMATLLSTMIPKRFKCEPKKVYFFVFEGHYLESKNEFKSETEFTCHEMEYVEIPPIKEDKKVKYGQPYTPALFKKVNRMIKVHDEKMLAAIDKESEE